MRKPLVVLADPDEGYIELLLLELLSELGNDADCHLITNEEYYREFAQSNKETDVLVVVERWHGTIDVRNVVQRYVLCEQEPPEITQLPGLKGLYKYSSPESICREVVRIGLRNKLAEMKRGGGSQLVAFCSPVGGAGTTSLALATSAALHENGLSALFVSLDELGSFAALLHEGSALSYEEFRALRKGGARAYQDLKGILGHKRFDFLAPLEGSFASDCPTSDLLFDFAVAARDSGDYDFIIVDMSSAMGTGAVGRISKANRVVVPVLSDPLSLYKYSEFCKMVDCSNTAKFLFVENKAKSDAGKSLDFCEEAVDLLAGNQVITFDALSKCPGVKAIARRII